MFKRGDVVEVIKRRYDRGVDYTGLRGTIHRRMPSNQPYEYALQFDETPNYFYFFEEELKLITEDELQQEKINEAVVRWLGA